MHLMCTLQAVCTSACAHVAKDACLVCLPQVLTPKQFGKAVVQSYPFFLDGTTLVDLLASDVQLQPSVNLGSLPQVILIVVIRMLRNWFCRCLLRNRGTCRSALCF